MNIEDQAIVLGRVEYAESDLILTLLSREHGRLSTMARSARRSRRRFGGALGGFTLSNITAKRRAGAEIWTLTSATPAEIFSELAADMVAFAHASYATEMVGRLVAPEVSEPEVFDWLLRLYRCISTHGASPPVLRCFELHIMRFLGTEPVLSECVICHDARDVAMDVGAVFDPELGGVVCRPCTPMSRGLGVKPVSGDCRRLLLTYGSSTLEDATAHVVDAAAATEARDLMMKWVVLHVGRPLQSLEFAAKMRSAQS